MNHDNERKAFEGYYIANYHDGDIHPHKKLLEWCEDGESYINSTIDNLWDMWLASANRVGYKLVPVEPTERMLDSAYSSISDNLHYADLENIYTAMIGACDD